MTRETPPFVFDVWSGGCDVSIERYLCCPDIQNTSDGELTKHVQQMRLGHRLGFYGDGLAVVINWPACSIVGMAWLETHAKEPLRALGIDTEYGPHLEEVVFEVLHFADRFVWGQICERMRFTTSVGDAIHRQLVLGMSNRGDG